MMDLYHADIRLPSNFTMPTRTVALQWSRHAEQAAKNDRYGFIHRTARLDLSKCRLVELGVENRRVMKIVVRTSYDDTRDVVYVLIPRGKGAWIVKTVWFNMRDDAHKTLDKSRYVR